MALNFHTSEVKVRAKPDPHGPPFPSQPGCCPGRQRFPVPGASSLTGLAVPLCGGEGRAGAQLPISCLRGSRATGRGGGHPREPPPSTGPSFTVRHLLALPFYPAAAVDPFIDKAKAFMIQSSSTTGANSWRPKPSTHECLGSPDTQTITFSLRLEEKLNSSSKASKAPQKPGSGPSTLPTYVPLAYGCP